MADPLTTYVFDDGGGEMIAASNSASSSGVPAVPQLGASTGIPTALWVAALGLGAWWYFKR